METNEKTVLNESENCSKKKHNKGIIIGIFLVVAIALAIGLGIYNSPANRISRQLDLGQKYLEEQNYEQAIVAFNEVIEIDNRCLEAYLGGMDAYEMIGDMDNQKALYEKALDVVREFSGEDLETDRENVVLLYLEAETVYAGDDEKILEKLKEGYNLTSDERLSNVIKKIEVRIKEELVRQEQLEKEGLWQFYQNHGILFGVMQDLCSGCLSPYGGIGKYITTDKEIEELFKPYIDRIERFCKYYPEQINALSALAEYYKVQGEFEKVLQIRQQLYDVTGNKIYLPDKTDIGEADDFYTQDEFGDMIYEKKDDSEREFLYDEKHRLISEKASFYRDYGFHDYIQYISTYVYDSEGKIEKKETKSWTNGIYVGYVVYLYEYTESGYTVIQYVESYDDEGLSTVKEDMCDVEMSIEYLEYGFRTKTEISEVYNFYLWNRDSGLEPKIRR